VQSEMDSGKTLTYLLPIVHCLASSTDNGRCPAPFPRRRHGGGRRGPQVLGDVVHPLVPHVRTSDADALIRQPTVPIFVPPDSPRVPLGRGEAQVREGAAAQGHNPPRRHAWAPAQPPDKDGEPPAIAPANCGLEWLVLNKVDCLLDGCGLGGRWSRLSIGFAGDATARRVGSGPPGHSRLCWCWRR
jgi:hypothetical protein